MESPHILQLAEWSTTSLAAIAAGGSAVIALMDYRRSQRVAEESRALQAYGECLDAAFANPQLASVQTPEELLKLSKSGMLEIYEWYVAKMLWSFEMMLIFTRRGRDVAEWRDTIKGQLRLHKPYLASSSFRPELSQYPIALRTFIADVLSEPETPRSLIGHA